MKSRIDYLIIRNKAKLNRLVEDGAPYEKILKQSKRLDKYIIIAMRQINKL